jgi:PleD family two-component response regulator
LKVNISAGIASASDCGKNFDSNDIIAKADKALYYSKRNGRNRVSVYREVIKEKL